MVDDRGTVEIAALRCSSGRMRPPSSWSDMQNDFASTGGMFERAGLQVRAGAHTGEVQLHGDDIAGIAVNTCARVCSVAAPGEILVTATLRDLVAGSGLTFTERGTHELKGVPGTWPLFAVGSGTVDESGSAPQPTRPESKAT